MEHLDLTTQDSSYLCSIEGDELDDKNNTVTLALTFSQAVKVRDFLIKVITENTIDSIKE
jgi:hypothetical protein